MKTGLVGPVLLVAVLGLASCSGDSDPEPETPTSAPTASESTTESTAPVVPSDAPAFGANCDVTGTVSGDVTATIDTVGGSSTDVGKQGPPAFYQVVTDKNVSITVYAKGNGFVESALLGSGSDSYGQPGAPQGVQAAADGSSASIDAELVNLAGDKSVQVQVQFTCSS